MRISIAALFSESTLPASSANCRREGFGEGFIDEKREVTR